MIDINEYDVAEDGMTYEVSEALYTQGRHFLALRGGTTDAQVSVDDAILGMLNPTPPSKLHPRYHTNAENIVVRVFASFGITPDDVAEARTSGITRRPKQRHHGRVIDTPLYGAIKIARKEACRHKRYTGLGYVFIGILLAGGPLLKQLIVALPGNITAKQLIERTREYVIFPDEN